MRYCPEFRELIVYKLLLVACENEPWNGFQGIYNGEITISVGYEMGWVLVFCIVDKYYNTLRKF